ncbi:MAG: hypothetical protein NT123_03735 [Proteobacteria bacterium]|nr:hypothetical protein [Pseudomonadota bacterium]
MPLAGKGMLITSMDVEAADEQEFNVWYDREHLAERVAIEGFLEARRWIADQASPKYFCTYSTAVFEDLSSPAYKKALANQTAWSTKNISRFKNMIRAVGRVTSSRGRGRGGALCVVRLRPAAGSADALRPKISDLMDPGMLPGIISMHLIESDPLLSKSLTEPDKPNPGASDWFLLVEGTDLPSVRALADARFKNAGVAVVSSGTYGLMWDLGKSDL